MSRGHERIQLHMTGLEIVTCMAEGNPGALTALLEIMGKGSSEIDPQGLMGGMGAILMLDTLGIHGSRIWMLFSDVCGRNVVKMIAVLRAEQLGQLAGVTEAALNHAIENRGDGLDLDAVVIAVCERLEKFNPVPGKRFEMIYWLAEHWDRFFSRVASMTSWRFRWLDYWCRCDRCADRRAKGLQEPYRGWRFWT